jgi:hypothetical protein
VTDEQIVKRMFSSDASWTRPDDSDYVGKVVARMAALRAEYPSGEYPAPTHGLDELGACLECDALKALDYVV